jgi:hypothetical protein
MEFFWFTLVGSIAAGIVSLYVLSHRGDFYPWIICIVLGVVELVLVPILKLPGFWLIVGGAMLILVLGVPLGFLIALAWAAGKGSSFEED